MVITLKFIGTDVPSWWILIRDSENSAIRARTGFCQALKIKCGFKVEFDCGYDTDNKNEYYRAITGEETEITAMLLKWS